VYCGDDVFIVCGEVGVEECVVDDFECCAHVGGVDVDDVVVG